jgi:chemotaxis protein CheZ
MENTISNSERLEKARLLVTQLEADNQTAADEIIAELSGGSDDELFQEVGRLTRELHEAINGFLLDERVAEMAEREIPDASERLKHVISVTEKSANTTLSSVENSIPLVDELEAKATALADEWGRFQERELSVDDFRVLSKDLATFLELVTDHSSQLHRKLTDVLMAQDFQDITGQIIKQVIELVQDVEDKLVQLIRISGSKMPEKVKQADPEKLEGPVIPGVDQGDVIQGQDDVDDLLSSLGF